MERLLRTLTIDAERAEVWRALTHDLSAWFGASVRVQALAPGAHMEFRTPDGDVRAAVIEEVVPEQLLAFRWLPFVRDAAGAARPAPVSRVEMLLDEDDDGVRVTVIETPMGARVWGVA